MRISGFARRALVISGAVALLSGCGGSQTPIGPLSASPSNFVPSGSLQSSLKQSESSAGSQARATSYYVLTLATLGGKQNYASAINNRGQVTGFSYLKGKKVEHAELWRSYRAVDLGTLGGPNSAVVWTNHNHSTHGQFVGDSEVSRTDPYGEDFCGLNIYTSHACLGFSWRSGKMTPLPNTLGGNNARASDVNDRGEIVGTAETDTKDPSCRHGQVFDYYGVIWQPNGKVVTLPPLSGDTRTVAQAINRSGQVVGSSGLCNVGAYNVEAHAVLWQNGSTINLGSLGGKYFNVEYDINDHGQVVGHSDLSGDRNTHAFLWQNGTMTDLGTLPGDTDSYAYGINDKGQVVGASCSPLCRGFLWQNGTMTDLNSLIRLDGFHHFFFIPSASDINNSGQITGTALAGTGIQCCARAFVMLPGRKAAALAGPHRL